MAASAYASALLSASHQYFECGPQVGLATVASSLQANGGTATVSYDELVDRLETVAAGIESGVTPQASALNFECLPQDLPEVLHLVSDVLRFAPALCL